MGRVLSGRRRAEAARELVVSEKTVRRWRGRFQREGSTGLRDRWSLGTRRVRRLRRCGGRWWRCRQRLTLASTAPSSAGRGRFNLREHGLSTAARDPIRRAPTARRDAESALREWAYSFLILASIS